MQLLKPYSYVDSCGLVWDVPAGAKVDGATIPQIFWSITGGPFEGRFRNASVIHDWFCDTKSRPWRNVHRMFLEGMLTAGVAPAKAKIMYAAVMVGGPKWDIVNRRNSALVRGRVSDLARYQITKGAPTGSGGPPTGSGAPPMTEQQFADLAAQIEREDLSVEQIDALSAAPR